MIAFHDNVTARRAAILLTSNNTLHHDAHVAQLPYEEIILRGCAQ
jgi:hypothetical protein